MTGSAKLAIALLLAASGAPAWAAPTGSAFTYQGRLLENGTPPTGAYDLEFSLYDVPAGGVPVLPPVTVEDVAVSGGLFTVSLDFGAAAFPGEARFMDIGVRPGSSTGPFTLLSGRQELRPTPNALAAPWAGVHGKPAGFADDVDNDVLGGLPCAAGEVAKWNGAAWACAADADSGGDITDVQAAPGGGLVGGATSGSAALGLLTSCPPSQLLKWNGAAWACAADADSGGDITDVQAAPGGGLVGGATSGSAALGLLTSCPPSQLLKWNGAAWACATDADSGGDITGITAGAGLSGGGTSGTVALQAAFGGTGAATTVSRTDHDHFGQTWSGSSSWGVRLVNSFTGGTNALRAETTDPAANSYAVYGITNSSIGRGVVGSSTATSGVSWGVYGFSASSIGRGVAGFTTSTTGPVVGVQGFIDSDAGAALSGFANALVGQARGADVSSNAASGVGVYGAAVGSGTTYGAFGFSTSPTSYGVYGWNQSLTGTTRGVYGLAYSTGGRGVEGRANASSGLNYGIYGSTGSSAGYAGYFVGRVHVAGTLSKAAGSFKIDHPLDPENKHLYHSFVESPDMKNIYDGIVTTDDEGYAIVELPEWFGALNRDFRYQLTVVDQSDAFVLAKVSREIEGNRFSLRTSIPGIKVSWQVTGIRKDPYAEKNRIPVEEDKPEAERGKYLYPAAYGADDHRGVDYDPRRVRDGEPGELPLPSAPLVP